MDERAKMTAVRVATRMLPTLPGLAARMGEAFRAEVPGYAALTEEEMREPVAIAFELVRTFFAAVSEGRPARVADVRGMEEVGPRRLAMGVSLEALLHVYRVAGKVVFDAVGEAVEQGEEVAVSHLGGKWMEFLDQAASRATNGYLRASQDRISRAEARREALIRAILAAADPSEVAAIASEFSISLAPRYAPVLSAGRPSKALADTLAASPPGSLADFRGSALVLLVPGDAPSAGMLERILGPGPVAWGYSAPPGPALRAEVEHAERLLKVAQARAVEGVCGPRDLLLDQLLAGDARVAQMLEETVLTPLREHDRGGVLLSTLRTYLATGSLPAAARSEVVHPNTVAYRLGRVAQLTGYNPRLPAEAAVLVLAVGPLCGRALKSRL